MKALEIKNLKKSYGKKEVLKGVDFSIKDGDFFALLGHNGAGKTTAIGIITDLVSKNSGSVKVFGVDIDKDFNKAKSYVGVVPQEFNFNIFSKVKDIPVEQAGYYGVPKKIAIQRTEKYLKDLGLWDKKDSQAQQLSGGMKRRLMIVRALVHNPKLLILDEPTAGIDVELRKSTWDFLRNLNKSGVTILLTTHYLEEVEALCNSLAIINGGEIIENTTTKQLLKSLDEEIIILDSNYKIDSIALDLEKKYKAEICDDDTQIKISLKEKYSINELIKDFDKNGIIISSFKNESSRLEQLFTRLTK